VNPSNNTLAARWQRRKLKFRNSWDKLEFNLFLHPQTRRGHDAVLEGAERALAQSAQHESAAACGASPDPLVRQGWQLKQQVETQFRNCYAGQGRERMLIQVPDPAYSPAGYSLFTNLAESLQFIGVPTRILEWHEAVAPVLQSFAPTVLLSSDHHSYLERLDWDALATYRSRTPLRIGLTASLEVYGNTPLGQRLAWARAHSVDFFYTFRDAGYVRARADYQPFFDGAWPILNLPFGANILHYYPVAGFARDLDYVLLATRKSEHMPYMKRIARAHAGFIDGPGWRHVQNFRFKRARDRYLYARARVGLNVHLPEQLEWACEVNERTYQLAACGVPQLLDHPLLIDTLYSRDAVFVADSPAHYSRLFEELMHAPERAQSAALLAQRETFARHTTFHRALAFMQELDLAAA